VPQAFAGTFGPHSWGVFAALRSRHHASRSVALYAQGAVDCFAASPEINVPRILSMTPSTLQALAVALALSAALPPQAWAWGSQGHRTVALVAEALLSPQAKSLVAQLRQASAWAALKPGSSPRYRQADRELALFCGSGPDAGSLDLVADWADAWRERHRDTEPWHFVDLPLDSDGSAEALDRACGGDCILTQLDASLALLNDPGADATRRLEALLWVVHLMGDLHQPLHCADHRDRGGNQVGVFLRGRVWNLHSVWDSGFFQVERARPGELALDLLSVECPKVPVPRHPGPLSFRVWARESFGVAQSFVYPQCRRLDASYGPQDVDQAWPVLRLQLARAGVRLAALLNGVAAPAGE